MQYATHVDVSRNLLSLEKLTQTTKAFMFSVTKQTFYLKPYKVHIINITSVNENKYLNRACSLAHRIAVWALF
jgi:hypothetical protein